MKFSIYFKQKFASSYCMMKQKKGFTMIEMLVVITIATLLIASVVVQQYSWNDQLSLNTQTYDMVLYIRQAQVYSLGVKEYKTDTQDGFNVGYGVYIDTNNSNQYVFFVDKNKDTQFDSDQEVLEIKNFKNGVYISKVCGFNGSAEKCSDSQGSLEKVEISFYRPEPKANLNFLNSGGNNVASFDPPAKIYLKSPRGRESSIKIEENGQISIQ